MLDLQVIDAFTDVPFAGNPAAVAIVEAFPPGAWMQAVAREMNLSETAFAARRADGDHDLRWFTPTTEVDLCGHATLATAHALGGLGRFHTRSGVLTATAAGDGVIELDFPADPPDPIDPPAAVTTPALTAAAPRAAVTVVAGARGRSDILVELADAAQVRAYLPDLAAIAALDARGLIVTARSDTAGVDFVSRVFCPAVGVPEDPVTGSAHCTLACYWAAQTGRVEMVGYQASARGGTVRVRVEGDRVVLGGRAVSVAEVRLLVSVPGT